jgi:hypothetical protein
MATGTAVSIIPSGAEVGVPLAVTAASAYTAGNSIGGLITIAGAVEGAGVGTVLQSIMVLDRSNQKPQGDIIFFSSNPAVATLADKTAFVFSTDDLKVVARVPIATADYVTINGKAIACLNSLNRIVSTTTGSTLYAAWITTSTPTFVAATDVQLTFGFVQSN